MIYVIGPKDKSAPIPHDHLVLNTTTSSKMWSRNLSPMLLGPVILPDGQFSKNVENAWQFSKVYGQHVGADGLPNREYYLWSGEGFCDSYAHRYPMGKGAVPKYSFWNGQKLDYIEARKRIYLPLYSEAVRASGWFRKLELTYKDLGSKITLWDFDGYDYVNLRMTLEEVLNNPDRKMGHAFVLAMMLQGLI